MKNNILYSFLEFQYSQLNDQVLEIGTLFYDPENKKITFECDRTKAKDIIYKNFPKVKFEIIELYLNLIQQKIEKSPTPDFINEIDFKAYINKWILTPDDSALQFRKVQKKIIDTPTPKNNMKKAKIFYFSLTDEMRKEDKLQWFYDNDFEKIPFERIRPDEKGNWLNINDNDFDTLIPVCSKDAKLGKGGNVIFELFSLGVVTARDEWVYDFSKENLAKKIDFLVDKYNQELDRLKGIDKKDVKDQIEYSIKWTRAVKNDLAKGKKYIFDKNKIVESLYRPFIKQKLYFSKELNEMQYQLPKIFGSENEFENKVICFVNSGNIKNFHTLVSNNIVDLHFTGDTNCLPFYNYDTKGNRKENITNWALSLFQSNYKDEKISKEDIFEYVYAVLHNPAYRQKYEMDLKRDFPRIPFYQNFWQYAEAGKELMHLHLNYETLPTTEYAKVTRLPLESLLPKRKKGFENDIFAQEEITTENEKLLKTIKPNLKLKVKDGIIEIDELTTIYDIPAEVWDYKLGNRSAVEWILDQYKPYKSQDKTIQEQFNNYNFFDYKEEVINLLLKVIYASVKTRAIIGKL